jgi:hypothetical protein
VLDLEDADAILAFVRDYGTLGGGLAYEAVTTPQGTTPFRCYSGAISQQDELRAKVDLITTGELQQHPVFRSEADLSNPFLTTGGEAAESRLRVGLVMSHVPPLVETVNEFRFAARCIRDVDAAWQALQVGGEADVELSFVLDAPDIRTPYGLTEFVASTLSCLLRPLSPQLGLSIRSGVNPRQTGREARSGVEPQREPVDVPLYTVCALELFDHMVMRAEYHICANERCGKRFVHQQGRAKKGQHRSRSVKYCSPSCARAAAQREYRRRRQQTESQ